MAQPIEQLRERYLAFFGEEGVGDGVIEGIEARLGVALPEDFTQVAGFYSGGLLGGISHHEIASEGDATNLVEETLRIREAVGLPRNFIVLAEPPESLIVLSVDASNGSDAVIWCDAVEVNALRDNSFINPPQTWKTYADFFEYLLDSQDDEE